MLSALLCLVSIIPTILSRLNRYVKEKDTTIRSTMTFLSLTNGGICHYSLPWPRVGNCGQPLFSVCEIGKIVAVPNFTSGCPQFHTKAAKGDLLHAEAKEVSCGPKIAVYTVRITDASGEVISLFEGMAYRKKEHWKL